MQGNELGLFCDILLKVWKVGDTYYGRYLKEAGLFETDEAGNMYDKARSKLAEYGNIDNLEQYGIDGITVEDGFVPLENSMEGAVLPDGFLFAVPYLYNPYILVTEELKPVKIHTTIFQQVQ